MPEIENKTTEVDIKQPEFESNPVVIDRRSDDLYIVKKFKDGDINAFEDIVKNYQNRIYNFCKYMLKDDLDAQDATQDVFIKAYLNLDKFNLDATLYTWLYRIAVNTTIDYKRKHNSILKLVTAFNIHQNMQSNINSPEDINESRDNISILISSLNKLSPKLRSIIILKEIEELSYEEICQILNVSIGTVKSRISRAREVLKKIIKHKYCT